jgi:hypothetical protein
MAQKGMKYAQTVRLDCDIAKIAPECITNTHHHTYAIKLERNQIALIGIQPYLG